ncbi:S-adenosyl-L-methionine-dependent methyltransferase [Thelonectria olida]|uniref:S-adenosyl-L-methionine-dependent methyltransferase n=1 Tax=Thelonectria olida TaxID=1576542 RepID=A0A9P8VST3_9HYPO|nr:S-adenosyl-L-methionine-dependent methyltransferase [Thelonectria olida]
MDFPVFRLADKPGTILIRRNVEVSEHEVVPFLPVDFPERVVAGPELAASLSRDDFGVSGQDVSTVLDDNARSGPLVVEFVDNGTNQLDPDEWDAHQSAYGNGTELRGSTTSLESDIKHYHRVYGRSFPSLKYGLSWNAVDDQSKIMNDYDHHFYLEQEDHQLFRAPVGLLHRVLDLGTGTGIWANEIAAAYPLAEVIGTDIAPIQSGSQPNCRFEIENMNDRWTRQPGSYDLVHGRGLLGNADDFHSLCTKAIAVLKPAGHLEIADRPVQFTGKDGPLDSNNVWFRVSQEVQQLNRMLGRPYDTAGPQGFRASMERAGFQTTFETRKTIPVTTCLETILDQIECALIMKLACEKIPDSQAKMYIRQLRRDLKAEAGGVCIEYVRIWGRKPCLQLIAGEINEYGLRVAMLRARSRFLRMAYTEICSKDDAIRASHYRRVTSGDEELRVPIEWVILCNDVRASCSFSFFPQRMC